jgi:mono/diheme cytochrome c family protein
MDRTALTSLLLVFCSLSACEPALNGVEHPAIMDRWALIYQGPCSSWLRSRVSGEIYCASPPIVAKVQLPAVDTGPRFDETKVDRDSLVQAGGKLYGEICAACHQADGNGQAGVYPPLAGSGEFYGDAQSMARIVVHGLSGPIVVQGQNYNGAMPPQGGALSDYEIAAVTTFVRSSWGNDDGLVLPDDVKAVR